MASHFRCQPGSREFLVPKLLNLHTKLAGTLASQIFRFGRLQNAELILISIVDNLILNDLNVK